MATRPFPDLQDTDFPHLTSVPLEWFSSPWMCRLISEHGWEFAGVLTATFLKIYSWTEGKLPLDDVSAIAQMIGVNERILRSAFEAALDSGVLVFEDGHFFFPAYNQGSD